MYKESSHKRNAQTIYVQSECTKNQCTRKPHTEYTEKQTEYTGYKKKTHWIRNKDHSECTNEYMKPHNIIKMYYYALQFNFVTLQPCLRLLAYLIQPTDNCGGDLNKRTLESHRQFHGGYILKFGFEVTATQDM